MEKDPGQLVSGVLDGLQWAEACALGPVVIAQVGLVVVKALSRHAECLGHAILVFVFGPRMRRPALVPSLGQRLSQESKLSSFGNLEDRSAPSSLKMV